MRFRLLIIMFFVFFSFSLVLALNADFDCPEIAAVNEEFACTLKISGAEGSWDFKFNLEKNDETIARIWNSEKESWSSAYYYLNEFIEQGETKEIKLIINEPGEFKDVIKLRQGSKREFFDYEITVEGDVEEKSEESTARKTSSEEEFANAEEESVEESVNERQEVISLSPIKTSGSASKNVDEENYEIVYESKNEKIIRNLSYAFSAFLLVFIAILMKDKNREKIQIEEE